MGWWHNRYKSRPPANCRSARAAWDLLTRTHDPVRVILLWYEPEAHGWLADLENGANDIVEDIEARYWAEQPIHTTIRG